eukprot:Selendium_serpulae@DN6504_c0_g1_i1.p1
MGENVVTLQSHRLPADIYLDERELCDLELMLMGAFKPLNGYMTREDYKSVLTDMKLKCGSVWPMPIVLPIPMKALVESANVPPDCSQIAPVNEKGHQIVKLRDAVGVIVGRVTVSDLYKPDLPAEMMAVCGSTDTNHPHVKHLSTYENCMYAGGDVCPVQPISHFDFRQYRQSADEVKAFISKNGWKNVVGFQTRNPMHRSHFELTQNAVDQVTESTGEKTNLLLTPAVGPTQPGDVEYHIRVRCYEKILPEYEKRGVNVKLIVLPLAMRMAGPREAVWHALIRRNFGCTHFIVGRDHAGPSAKTKEGKSFYGPYEAHELLKKYQGEMGVIPVFGKNMVYVGESSGGSGYCQDEKVPKGVTPKNVSGTEFRDMLQKRLPVPEWFSFPSVITELQKHYLPLHQRGLCVYFTGLPCSGKSTLAVALQERLLERPNEMRRVTVLDADIIRTHLSKGLGFSKEDRSVNVRRIGYVAYEIVKHGGVCLVANIAPYEEDRSFNRALISSGGHYVESFVSTPLDVCEQRDIKELYKKARQGVIKQFTGISDPYETPLYAEINVDSSGELDKKIDQVFDFLKAKQFVM